LRYRFLVRLPLLIPSRKFIRHPAPVLVWLHARSGSYDARMAKWPQFLVLFPDDNVAGIGHTGWFGYRSDIASRPRRPVRVVPYTQRRLLYYLAFVAERYRIDTSRIWVAGRSMGGTGAILLAGRWPNLFAGAWADRPALTPQSARTVQTLICRLLGPQQARLAVDTGASAWDEVSALRTLERLASSSLPHPYVQVEVGLDDRIAPARSLFATDVAGWRWFWQGLLPGALICDERSHRGRDPLVRWWPEQPPWTRPEIAANGPLFGLDTSALGAVQFRGDRLILARYAGGLPEHRTVFGGLLRWRVLAETPATMRVELRLVDAFWQSCDADSVDLPVRLFWPAKFVLPPEARILIHDPGREATWIEMVRRPGQLAVKRVRFFRNQPALLEFAHADGSAVAELPVVTLSSATHPDRFCRFSRDVEVAARPLSGWATGDSRARAGLRVRLWLSRRPAADGEDGLCLEIAQKCRAVLGLPEPGLWFVNACVVDERTGRCGPITSLPVAQWPFRFAD